MLQKDSKICLTLERALAFVAWFGCIFMLCYDYMVANRPWSQFLTFTFVSNITVAVTFTLRGFDIIDRKSYDQKVWFSAIASAMLIVCIVFWTLISKDVKVGPWGWVSTCIIHGITPISVISLYIYQAIKTNGHRIDWKHIYIAILMPITWIIMEQIMHFTLGLYFYNFLKKTSTSYFYIAGIAIAFLLVSAFFIWLNNYLRKLRDR